jgi:hypothetical protein
MCCVTSIVVVLVLGASVGTVHAKEIELPAVNPADFHYPPPAYNPYLPLTPVTTYVYEAEEEDGLVRNEITVTPDTKVILGITCTVVYDVEWIYVEDLDTWFMTEETFDWHTTDDAGNVWYFGEDTREYLYDDDWNPAPPFWTTEGSWEAGVDGAEPGIVMLAEPMPGLSYRQEYYEDEAEDMGKVLRLNAIVSVEYGDFENCVKTKEWSRLELGTIEHKYYAEWLGLVFVEELKEKTVHVELVDVY